MKKIITVLFICMIFMSGCGKTKSSNAEAGITKPYVKVNLQFNSKAYKYTPTFVIWLEDEANENMKTLYITEKAGLNKWSGAKERPSALPVWNGIKGTENVDTVSSATPGSDNAELILQIPEEFYNKKVNMYLEANVSFDYNDYYKNDLKPGDDGYNDVNGQPSIIWKASFNTGDKSEEKIIPGILGHGNVLGGDHKVDSDMKNITTAKDVLIMDVNYYPGSSGK